MYINAYKLCISCSSTYCTNSQSCSFVSSDSCR